MNLAMLEIGVSNMVNLIKKLWNDDAGAAAAEYALILAVVGTGIAAAAIALGTEIGGAMNTAAGCIKTASTC